MIHFSSSIRFSDKDVLEYIKEERKHANSLTCSSIDNLKKRNFKRTLTSVVDFYPF